MEKTSTEHHPDWYFDIPTMKTLILGSFPPHAKQRYYEFYYPNAMNRFWKILADIAGVELTKYKKKEKAENEKLAVQERYNIMLALNVGVQNMGKTIQRKGESANDNNIEITEYQDILGIIRNHPELTTILLPGFSAPNSTYWSFIKYLNKNNFQLEPQKPSLGMSFEIDVDDRKIKCVVLYSTSTATKLPYETVIGEFRKYLQKSNR